MPIQFGSDLELPRDPTCVMHAVTKQYVDALTTGGTYRETFTGNGTGISFPITHNLGTNEVSVEVFKTVSGKPVPFIVPWEVSSVNVISILFAVAPISSDSFIVKVRK